MKLLAIETSTTACSVALSAGDAISDRHVVEPRAHTGILLPMIRELLDHAALDVGSLDAVVLGNGPGSFIGMRIGASVAQGLCYGAGIDIVPVSSLAAVAAEAMVDGDTGAVLVAQDARMGEVYIGAYHRGDDGLPALAISEKILPADNLASIPGAFVAAGDAWYTIDALADHRGGNIIGKSAVRYPAARHLLALGRRTHLAGGSCRPQDLVPTYLRTRVAEKPSASPQ